MPSPDLIVFDTKTRCSLCKKVMPDNKDFSIILHLGHHHPEDFAKLAKNNPTNQEIIRAINTMESENRFRNFYRCEKTKQTWQDDSPATNEDECPCCGHAHTPYRSIDLPLEP